MTIRAHVFFFSKKSNYIFVKHISGGNYAVYNVETLDFNGQDTVARELTI